MARKDPEVDTTRAAAARTDKRATRLEALAHSSGARGALDTQVARAREKVWRVAQPRHVRLRLGLLQHRGAAGDSPLLAVSTSKGCGVQLLLVALFEAQCRRTRLEATRPTKRALRGSTSPEVPSWLDLIAVATENRRAATRTARTPEDNRHDQVRSALERLEDRGRLQAPFPTGRGRFKGFTLLHEATDNTGTATTYSAPKDSEVTVDVPTEFWLNGWVHALYDSEIAAYLFLLAVEQVYRRAGKYDDGVRVSAQDWEWAFGPSRAGLVAQRHLVRFGLIDVVRPEDRRADGTVEGVGTEGAEIPFTPHLYRTRERGLEFRAVPTITQALHQAHDLNLDEATMFQDLVAPDGWTFNAAVAEREQQRLAAPTPPTRAR